MKRTLPEVSSFEKLAQRWIQYPPSPIEAALCGIANAESCLYNCRTPWRPGFENETMTQELQRETVLTCLQRTTSQMSEISRITIISSRGIGISCMVLLDLRVSRATGWGTKFRTTSALMLLSSVHGCDSFSRWWDQYRSLCENGYDAEVIVRPSNAVLVE